MLAVLLLNVCISTYTALAAGSVWVEARVAGGGARLVAWMGAAMAAIGFTMGFTFIAALISAGQGWLPGEPVRALLALEHLVTVVPLVGAGLVLTVQGWAVFWRRRTFASGATAAWNAFAKVSSTVQAFAALPEALEVGSLFSNSARSSSSEGGSAGKAHGVGLVAVCLLPGVLLTIALVRLSARRHAASLRADARALAYARTLALR